MDSNDKYFAAKDKSLIGDCIVTNFKDYYRYLQATGRLYLYSLSNFYFYQGMRRGGTMGNAGMQGQHKTIGMPVYSPLARTLYTLVLSEAPTLSPVPINASDIGKRELLTAKAILDYEYDTLNKKKSYHEATMFAAIYGDGYAVHRFDLHSQDLDIKSYNPAQVAFDPTVTNKDQIKWHIVRDRVNKWDLSAEFPLFSGKIQAQTLSDDVVFQSMSELLVNRNDACYTYELIHMPTLALPKGRIVLCLADGTVLSDTEYSFKNKMVTNVYHYMMDGTGFGYTTLFDVLALQQGTNAITSSIVTSLANFGSKLLASSRNPTVAQLNGLTVFTTDGRDNPPQAIDMIGSQTQHYDLLNLLRESSNRAASLNDTVMTGNSNQSGSAKVFDKATAISQAIGLKDSVFRMFTDGGNVALEICKNMPTKDVALLVGKFNKYFVQDWSGQSLEKIKQVVAEVVPLAQKSQETRIAMADMLMQYGEITPEQYLNVMSIGSTEKYTDSSLKLEDLLQAENEMLLDGEIPEIAETDDHLMHYLEHCKVQNDVHVRGDGAVITAVGAHTKMHLDAMNMMIASNPGQFLLQSKDKEMAMQMIQNYGMMQQQAMMQPPMPQGGQDFPTEDMSLNAPLQEPSYPEQPTMPQGVNL